MTRIAYILKMYPRFSETFIVNEILELERQGVDVRIYSLCKPDDGRFHPSVTRVKANVVYVPQYPEMEPERVRQAHAFLAEARPAAYAAARAYVDALGQPFALRRFLQAGVIAAHLLRNPVHAVHAHFASSPARVANFVSRLTGLPYSFTAHAKDIFHQEVDPVLLRKKVAAARFVVTVSHFNRRYLQELMGDEPCDIRCLYNGIDLDYFRPDPTVPQEPDLIVAVGRLVEKKGFDRLIRACARLAGRGLSFRCEIIGTGEQREALAALIAQLGLEDRVVLVGPKPQDAVLTAYRRAAVFVLPCVVGRDGNRDGLPTVLIEAMATGLPVVTTTVTGNPEIVDHGVNGLLVPPDDVEALADALARLLRSSWLRQQMGMAARRKAERVFDVRRNVARLHEWLAEPAPVAAEPPLPAVLSPLAERLAPIPPAPALEEVLWR